MDYSGRYVDHRAFEYRVLHAVQLHTTFTIQHVVKLCTHLMVVLARTVDIDGVSPSRNIQVTILAADQQVPPAAGAAFARHIRFVPDQGGRRSLSHE